MNTIKNEILFFEKKSWVNGTAFISNFVVAIILRVVLVYFFDGILEYHNYDKEHVYVLRHIWNASMYLIPMVFFALSLKGLIVFLIASYEVYALKNKQKNGLKEVEIND